MVAQQDVCVRDSSSNCVSCPAAWLKINVFKQQHYASVHCIHLLARDAFLESITWTGHRFGFGFLT